jgi:hypothetical protein
MREYRSKVKLGKAPVVSPNDKGESSKREGLQLQSQQHEADPKPAGHIVEHAKSRGTTKKSDAQPSRAKNNQRQFMGNEFARLFHVIFDDSDEGRCRLDRLMTGMTRQQVIRRCYSMHTYGIRCGRIYV